MYLEALRIPVPNGELHAERAGTGHPLVLLHAGTLDASMWDDQLDAFTAGHTVIRYDARNHGRSSTATADFRPEDDLRAVLDHLDIPSAALLGSSYGGATATAFARTHPERVSGLVLAGPGITPVEFRDPFVQEHHREQAAAIEAGDVARYLRAFLRYAVDGPHRQPSEVDPGVRQRCREMAERTVYAHHTATGFALERDTMSRIERIGTPALFVMGDLDLPDLHRIADAAVRRMPNANKVIVPGAGHMVNVERPEAFNELALRHLATAAASGALGEA